MKIAQKKKKQTPQVQKNLTLEDKAIYFPKS